MTHRPHVMPLRHMRSMPFRELLASCNLICLLKVGLTSMRRPLIPLMISWVLPVASMSVCVQSLFYCSINQRARNPQAPTSYSPINISPCPCISMYPVCCYPSVFQQSGMEGLITVFLVAIFYAPRAVMKPFFLIASYIHVPDPVEWNSPGGASTS